jgi:hypothetical protein
LHQAKFGKIETKCGHISARGKEIPMNCDIDEEAKKFKYDPSIEKRLGKDDINAKIRMDNMCKSKDRVEKQALLDSWIYRKFV